MSQSNIHTLATTTTEKKIKKKIKIKETNFTHPKPKEWKQQIIKWVKIGKANEDSGEILPIFLKPKSKSPSSGIVYSRKDYSAVERWDKNKLSRWIEQNKYNYIECDLGILISGLSRNSA